MSKVMERMVNRRLKHFLESHDLLDHRQHAFRAGHGTSTYFAQLGEVLQTAYSSGYHTEIVSLDLSKAFNRTWAPSVLRQLVQWSLSGHIVRFVQNFLLKRSFRVLVGGFLSDSYREETGVPQGSVIAVTLFLVAMNGVFSTLPKGIYVFVYADDILLVVSGKTPVRVRIKTQAAVNAVHKWASAVGFELSASKSVRCHVCPSNHRNSVPIVLNGLSIPTRKTVKVLGITVDHGLTFRHHFDSVKQSCHTRINIIRTISHPHRSNNRAVRFRVAHAIIDSRLTYGLELTCVAVDQLVSTLAPVYHGYIRNISGLLPSTPADSSCVEAGFLPFRLFIYAAVCRKASAIAGKTSGDDGIFILSEGRRILRAAANVDLPLVAKVHWHGDISWHSSKPSIDNFIANQFRAGDNSTTLRITVLDWLRTKYAGHEKRYTDGSLSNRGVGLGVSAPDISLSLSLPPICSVFSAEAAAICTAASIPSDRPVLILTDSASAISALQSERPTHPWIQAILENALPNTTYSWIPGHCGIPGNMAADALAGSGHSAPRYDETVPFDDVNRWITNTFRNAWSAEWARRNSPYLRKVKITTDRWIDCPLLKDQRVISRLRTGHTRVSHNMSGHGPFKRICSVCGVHNSVEHFVCICPQQESARSSFGISESIRSALGNDASTVATLISFLKAANLYDQI